MPLPTVICPYCKKPAPLVDSALVYGGTSYGPIYCCKDCDAWVRCHKGTTRRLGRMANAELGKLRTAVHDVFDPVWKRLLAARQRTDPSYSKNKARTACYTRLAERMGIPLKECHIANFDPDQCRQAIAIIVAGKRSP
jgi:hypothetical protein